MDSDIGELPFLLPAEKVMSVKCPAFGQEFSALRPDSLRSADSKTFALQAAP